MNMRLYWIYSTQLPISTTNTALRSCTNNMQYSRYTLQYGTGQDTRVLHVVALKGSARAPLSPCQRHAKNKLHFCSCSTQTRIAVAYVANFKCNHRRSRSQVREDLRSTVPRAKNARNLLASQCECGTHGDRRAKTRTWAKFGVTCLTQSRSST